MIVVKTRETKPQRKLENSHQEVKNAWGAFAVEGVPALLLVPKQFDNDSVIIRR